MKARSKVFAKNVAHQYALRVAMYVFPLVTLPYLTRVLGPDSFAVRAYVLSTMSFVSAFLNFGFDAYGTRAVAIARDDSQEVRRVATAITGLRLGLCALGAVPVALLAAFIPILAENPAYVAVAYAGACLKALLPDFLFQGLEDMGIITRRYVVSQAVAVALILALIHGSADLLLVPVIEAAAGFIALAWSWGDVLARRGLLPLKPAPGMVRYALGESSVLFVSSVSTTAFTALTTIMIGLYVQDQAEISYWSLAMTAVGVAQGLYTPVNNSLYPHMCANPDFSIVRRFLAVGAPVSLLGSVLFALFSEPIMLVAGGEGYLAGSYVLVLVSPVVFFSFVAMLLGFPVLGAVGRTKQLTASSIIAASFHVCGLIALAICGMFAIAAVAVLRSATELVLCAARAGFSASYFKSRRRVQES